MIDVSISSIGTYLPGPPIDNKTLSAVLKVNEEWIDFFIGTKSRHFCMDMHTGKQIYTLSDICVEAAKKAITQSGVHLSAIEAIILSTATPDHLMPATVNMIADKLGLNHVATYQLQSGCGGAIQALDVGAQLIKSERFSNILVIGGDVCNKFLDLQQDFTQLSSNELINYVLFGDGAGAVVLTREQCSGIILGEYINRFTGLGQLPGQMINWFGVKNQEANQDIKIICEDYKAIELKVPMMARELLYELLAKMRWQKAAVDYFLPPQLSKNMTEKIIAHLDLPIHKTINCVELTGNNGNALPFMQLAELFPLMTHEKNQKGVMIAIESSKWLKAGLTFYV